MAIYYVDPVGGLDTNDGLSLATAWLTTQQAANTAVSGDEVRLCATGVESIGGTIVPVATGVRYVGVDATGNWTSGTRYTMQASAAITAIFRASVVATILENVELDAANMATHAAYQSVTTSIQNLFARNCIFRRAVSHGLNMSGLNESYPHTLLDCQIYDNGGNGYYGDGDRGPLEMCGCVVRDNGSSGIFVFNDSVNVRDSLVYRNTGAGIVAHRYARHSIINGNTVAQNGTTGILLQSASGNDPSLFSIYNNAVVGNGGTGIDVPIGSTQVIVDYNLEHGNGSNSAHGNHAITVDPQFVDAAAANFTPGDGSPLIGSGLGGRSIGAVEPLVPTGTTTLPRVRGTAWSTTGSRTNGGWR